MKIPLMHRNAPKGSYSLSAFLVQVLVPGLVVLYLMRTEGEYIATFTADNPVLLSGEVIFLSIHLIFTYVALPAAWCFDSAGFFIRDSHVLNTFGAFFNFWAAALFWLLFAAVVLRIVATF